MLRKHITIISPIFPPEIGGPASYVSGLAQRLSLKHQVTVITFVTSQAKHFDSFEVIGVKTSTNFVVRQLMLMRQILQQVSRTDVLYVQGTVTVGVISWLVSKLFSKPMIVKFVGDEIWEAARQSGQTDKTLEDYYKYLSGTEIKLRLHRLVLNQAQAIVTPTKSLGDFLTKWHQVPASKIRVIPNPVEVHFEPLTAMPGNKRLIYVGRLVKWKNVDQIIQALVNLKEWSLLVVGSGPEETNLKSLAQKLQVKVQFVGNKTNQQVQKLMKTADALVLLSDYEGQSHVLIEALQLRLPVIASNIPANRAIVKNDGALVPRDNIPKLVEAVSHIKRNSITKTKKIRNRFSWQQHIKQLLEVFDHES